MNEFFCITAGGQLSTIGSLGGVEELATITRTVKWSNQEIGRVCKAKLNPSIFTALFSTTNPAAPIFLTIFHLHFFTTGKWTFLNFTWHIVIAIASTFSHSYYFFFFLPRILPFRFCIFHYLCVIILMCVHCCCDVGSKRVALLNFQHSVQYKKFTCVTLYVWFNYNYNFD